MVAVLGRLLAGLVEVAERWLDRLHTTPAWWWL